MRNEVETGKLDMNREESDRLNKDVEEVIEDEEEGEHRREELAKLVGRLPG